VRHFAQLTRLDCPRALVTCTHNTSPMWDQPVVALALNLQNFSSSMASK
jgi:hypothetical protein